jgi:hypothetical protein
VSAGGGLPTADEGRGSTREPTRTRGTTRLGSGAAAATATANGGARARSRGRRGWRCPGAPTGGRVLARDGLWPSDHMCGWLCGRLDGGRAGGAGPPTALARSKRAWGRV